MSSVGSRWGIFMEIQRVLTNGAPSGNTQNTPTPYSDALFSLFTVKAAGGGSRTRKHLITKEVTSDGAISIWGRRWGIFKKVILGEHQ